MTAVRLEPGEIRSIIRTGSGIPGEPTRRAHVAFGAAPFPGAGPARKRRDQKPDSAALIGTVGAMRSHRRNLARWDCSAPFGAAKPDNTLGTGFGDSRGVPQGWSGKRKDDVPEGRQGA
jgi:hypothetical protein